jgi:hypothetical protein
MSLLFLPLVAWRVATRFVGTPGGRSDGAQALPAWLNALLKAVMSVEQRLSDAFPLPFGSTLLCATLKLPSP